MVQLSQRNTSWALVLTFSVLLAFAAAACSGPKYPKCENDKGCKAGEFCVNGNCQQCRSDDDCPAGKRCNSGRCDAIQGYCNGDQDCGPGQECVGNRCTQAESTPEPEPEPEPASDPEPSKPECAIDNVFFEFDSDDISSTGRQAIQSNVNCLSQKDISSLHLTGHCDPRGTEEYNLALGDRRARAVKKYMKTLGFSGSMSTSSMGEEMASGRNENGWGQDRRVEVKPK